MTVNNFFCKLCGDYIEGYNIFDRFQKNDPERLIIIIIVLVNVKIKYVINLDEDFLLNINYFLNFIIFIIGLCFYNLK